MIVLLWVLTIGSYDLFHLFDYLALGLGIAGYLLLSGLPDSPAALEHARELLSLGGAEA